MLLFALLLLLPVLLLNNRSMIALGMLEGFHLAVALQLPAAWQIFNLWPCRL